MKLSLSLPAFVLLASALLAGNPVHAQTYTYIDLGSVQVSSINTAGQIIGWINTANGPQGFLITPLDTNGDGKPDTWYQDANGDGVNDLMSMLPTPPGHTGCMPHGLNAFGDVAGEARGKVWPNKVDQQAFFTAAGASTSEIFNSTSSYPSYASGVNDNGVLSGWAYTNSGNAYAATWQKTVTRKGTTWQQTLLGAPTGYTSTRSWGPQAINNDGAVAARTESPSYTPAVWLPSALYGLPQGWTLLPGLSNNGGDSRAINNNGQLSGGSNGHAALWLLQSALGLSAGIHDLHPLGTVFTNSWADGLNNAPNGVLSVVGQMNDGVSLQSAFVWRSDTGQTIDLNTVTTGIPAGLVLVEAKAVNDGGVIVGLSQQRAFVLVPNP